MNKEDDQKTQQTKTQEIKYNVSNCPDLTGLWFRTNGKRQSNTITGEGAKKIYDVLNTLERYGLCELKFGI